MREGSSHRFPESLSSGLTVGFQAALASGNRNRKDRRIYHVPTMPYYEATRAEEVFCTEARLGPRPTGGRW